MSSVTATDDSYPMFTFMVTFDKVQDSGWLGYTGPVNLYNGRVVMFEDLTEGGVTVYRDYGIIADDAEEALFRLKLHFAGQLERALSPGGLLS